jgi:chromosome segregation ATPase
VRESDCLQTLLNQANLHIQTLQAETQSL